MEGLVIGRVVHFRGREDGYACKASLVDHVHSQDTGMVNLVVARSMGEQAFVRRTSVYFEDNAPRGDDGNVSADSWHWPGGDNCP